MTDDEVQEALIKWCATLTGLPVVKARQGVERPSGPYLMVDKQTVEELYENVRRFDNEVSDDGQLTKVTPIVELEWLMFVFSFGEGKSSALRRIKQAVYVKQIQESLGSSLNIHDTGVINSIPEFINQKWEERSQLNVMIRGLSGSGESSDGFAVDTIEQHTPFDFQKIS